MPSTSLCVIFKARRTGNFAASSRERSRSASRLASCAITKIPLGFGGLFRNIVKNIEN